MDNNYLNIKKILAYSSGMLGWSILITINSVMLIYFYLPPEGSGMEPLIPQITLLKIFSVLALIAAGGRLFDAVSDPWIAWISDKSKLTRGRRLPFMRFAWLPAFVCCFIVFVPARLSESHLNIITLILSLVFFYLFLTIYNIPYNALMPELAQTSRDKIKLSTWLSLAYVGGLILAAQTPLLADLIEHLFDLPGRARAFQIAIMIMCAIAGIFLMIPAYAIDEKKFRTGKPAEITFRKSLTVTLKNRNFRLFLVADFAYFMAVAIISGGMLYYLKVLLGLDEAMSSTVFGAMIIVSVLFYPLVMYISKYVQKKYLMSFGLVFMGVVFLAIYFLGKLPMSPTLQIYLFALLASIPVALLGIIPYAVIAEIAQLDGLVTSQNKEGMYFAVRNFFYKLGMTAGIMIFTILTLWGKDPGDDLGIRLNGIFGFVLCVVAGLVFLLYRERDVVNGIEEHRSVIGDR
ncbi:MAG: MFS transporter [Bacteroidales bacterium]|nr:MFS transporter [Bacteroidales bacterium]